MIALDVVEIARGFIDTPFVHQGRIPGRALDCAGMVVMTLKAANVTCMDFAGYGRTPAHGLLEESLDVQDCMYRIPLGDRKSGDILLLRFSGEPQHLAIDGGDTIIHSYSKAGKVCEHVMTKAWISRLVRAYRLKEVE